MFVLFTSEKNTADEREQLIDFFNNGLSVLHVRKPGMTEHQLKLWLLQFEEKHHGKMVLHQQHQLAQAFPLKGIHLKENFRRELKDSKAYIQEHQAQGLSVSTSFHDLERLQSEASAFDYVFLSPVFTSVSKEGYTGKEFNVQSLAHKVIALGGIKADKISEVKEMGYSGIAVLGSIWRSQNKREAFENIKKTYEKVNF